eukprot:2664450-Prymnesium_polylepis.1
MGLRNASRVPAAAVAIVLCGFYRESTGALSSQAKLAAQLRDAAGDNVSAPVFVVVEGPVPVSYTHLTLPTICSV